MRPRSIYPHDYKKTIKFTKKIYLLSHVIPASLQACLMSSFSIRTLLMFVINCRSKQVKLLYGDIKGRMQLAADIHVHCNLNARIFFESSSTQTNFTSGYTSWKTHANRAVADEKNTWLNKISKWFQRQLWPQFSIIVRNFAVRGLQRNKSTVKRNSRVFGLITAVSALTGVIWGLNDTVWRLIVALALGLAQF